MKIKNTRKYNFTQSISKRVLAIPTALVCLFFSIVVPAQVTTNEGIAPIISLLLLEEPQISILSDTVVAEGNSGTQTVNLRVIVSPYAESSVNVAIAPDSSAQQGSDYSAPELSRINFVNGVAEVVLSFEIIGDTVDEAAESFTVRLFDPAEVELSSNDSATITIIDDESLYNDTGIQVAGEAVDGFRTNCSGPNVVAQQDCANGRDAQASAGSLAKLGGGVAGFDFTKLGADGQPLRNQNGTYSPTGSESAGTIWSCARDNHTGLVWEVKTVGGLRDKDIEYRWGGLTAFGRNHIDREGVYFDDWNTLVNHANSGTGLCGRKDWHIPSIKALSTIVYYGRSVDFSRDSLPAIDINYFPNTAMDNYWSASPDQVFVNLSDTQAWVIHFGNAKANDSTRERRRTNRVRLVSGAHEPISTDTAVAIGRQAVKNYIPNTTPDSRYSIGNNSTTVVDLYTGLMWQRCQLGLSGANCTNGTRGEYNWNEALTAAQNNTLSGFTDWRLPSLAELRTLTAYDREFPAINSSVFPNTDNENHGQLTSTPTMYFAGDNRVWTIQSLSGSDSLILRTIHRDSIRLVRGGTD